MKNLAYSNMMDVFLQTYWIVPVSFHPSLPSDDSLYISISFIHSLPSDNAYFFYSTKTYFFFSKPSLGQCLVFCIHQIHGTKIIQL